MIIAQSLTTSYYFERFHRPSLRITPIFELEASPRSRTVQLALLYHILSKLFNEIFRPIIYLIKTLQITDKTLYSDLKTRSKSKAVSFQIC